MRIRITKGGIYGNEGKEIPVGTELTVKEEPKAWAGRYEIVGGAPVAEEQPKTLVTGDTGDRKALLQEIAGKLTPEEFNDEGKPEVVAINRNLPDGVEPFSASERDELWQS